MEEGKFFTVNGKRGEEDKAVGDRERKGGKARKVRGNNGKMTYG